MGANYETATLNDMPRKAVREHFDEMQDRDRFENGHMYSGGFGMASGLMFADRPPFNDLYSAHDHVMDAAEKWGPAVAVQFRADDGALRWFIGAWCSC